MNRRSHGFSVVEVLIVIVIVGIAVGIIAMVIGNIVDDRRPQPKTVSAVEQAKDCQTDQRVYALAVQAFKIQHEGQLPKSEADIAPIVKQPSKYWTVTDSGKSTDRVQPKPGASLPRGCLNDPKT